MEEATPTKSLSVEAEEEPHKTSLTEDPVQQILSVEERNEQNNEDEKGGDDEPEEEIKRGPLYRCLVFCHCRCLAQFLDHWPRVSSFLIGVLIPLWALIAISSIFGAWLAIVEAPQEIENNDAAMAHAAKLNLMANLFANVTSFSMIVCIWKGDQSNNTKLVEFHDFLHFFNKTLNETHLEEILAETKDINDIFANFMTNFTTGGAPDGEDIFVTVSAARLIECTELVRNLTSIMYGTLARYAMEIEDPTFAWNRCSDEVNDTSLIPFPDLGSSGDPSYKPEAQRLFYAEAWIADRDRILDELRQQNPNSTARDEVQMFITASDQATGSQSCEPNSAASTWFWFTIMTTMGYGNQSPNTSAGRAMVYTLGFVSLLCFGGILAYSGFVISSILDDALRRTKVNFLLNNLVSCLMWGCFSYIWMLVIAQHYISWRKDRLDDTISFANGYWFAYISTTTIGLGDFVLEPEVITGRDLLTFPFLILIGFVFFSAFLGKFGELFARDDDSPSQTLQARLAATRLLLCCRCRRRSPPS